MKSLPTSADSPYRDKLSMAILGLQENGKIQMLYNKWWKDTGTCVRDEDKGSKANALGVENVGGIFVVLMAGLALAIIVAICEFVWRSRKNAREDKVGAPGLAVPENAREDKVGAPGLVWSRPREGFWF